MIQFGQIINQLSPRPLATRPPLSHPSDEPVDTIAPEPQNTQNQQLEKLSKNFTAGLTPAEQSLINKLKIRDAEVRRHEQAHAQAAGPYLAQGPQYTYQRGPDNRLYAIGGSVQLDVSKESTPEETIDKAETIKRAALAPAVPSSQDLNVARQAEALLVEARREIQKQKQANQTFSAQAEIESQAPKGILLQAIA